MLPIESNKIRSIEDKRINGSNGLFKFDVVVLVTCKVNEIYYFQAVILHTDSALDLLKRRKMKKEFLFRYLHDKKVPIEASAEKTGVVKKILELWGSSDDTDMFLCDENSLDAPPPAPVPSRKDYNNLIIID